MQPRSNTKANNIPALYYKGKAVLNKYKNEVKTFKNPTLKDQKKLSNTKTQQLMKKKLINYQIVSYFYGRKHISFLS